MKCNCNGATCLVMTIGVLDNTITEPMRKCLECGKKWHDKQE